MKVDPRFTTGSGVEVFNGNELLIKGCLEVEGGVNLMTGYPGSPVAGFFDIMGDIQGLLQAKGVRAFQANNEALGAAAVNGSQMAATRAVVTFKSVGTHVASDALALGNLAGAHPDGGVVVISGDDPWCDSTQVPADCRFLFEHLRMAVVEPGSPQEIKDWINLSFKLSRVAGVFIGYVVTTALADGGGSVICRENQYPALNTKKPIELDTKQIDLDKLLLPPRTWQHELAMPERLAKTMRAARELGINRIYPANPQAGQKQDSSPLAGSQQSSPTRAPLGFITTGMGRAYLDHVLSDIGLLGYFPVLNMGMPYPCDVELVAEFSQQCEQMIVIEERRSFLEKNIRDRAYQELPHDVASDLVSRLYGKQFPAGKSVVGGQRSAVKTIVEATHDSIPSGSVADSPTHRLTDSPVSVPTADRRQPTLPGIPEGRGLNPSLLAQLLIPLIQQTTAIPAPLRNGKLTETLALIRSTQKRRLEVLGRSITDDIIPRTPTFCPGCPHRDSSALLLELRKNFSDPQYMADRGHKPVDLVAHGDTGCYTMLMFAPTEQLMHNYSGMGLGAGTGTGIDPFITNKQLVFMGDGTFFHSGQIAISNAVKANQDITFIILKNDTTAMTGHQEHAGTELDVLGNRSYVQDIEAIVRGMAGSSPMTVEKLSPADRTEYRKTLEATLLKDGVKVIIADKECGITYNRTQLKAEKKIIKEKGYLPEKWHMNVTEEVCEHCLECTKATACPGLTVKKTDYGPKIDTDLTWCTNDGACERVTTSNSYGNSVKPCPSFEQVKIVRKKRKRYMLPKMDLAKLPEPTRIHNLKNIGDAWRCHMAGVGGMGIGVVSAIMVRAGHMQGYKVVFADKKGLAIRNGGVYSQITWVNDGGDPHRSLVGRPDGEVGHEGRTIEERPDTADISAAGHSNADATGSPIENSGASHTSRHRTSEAHPLTPHASSLTPTFSTTGTIPFGRCDLLLGIDVLEAARAIDPRENFRVANKQRTAAVLNTHKQATVSVLLGQKDFDPEKLREDIFEHCDASNSYAKNLSQICEERLGSKQFVNILALGVAYQLGLIPVSTHNIAWAIKDTVRRGARQNIKAFNIGRKLALEPRALPHRPEARTWQQVLTQKTKILRKTALRGDTLAQRLELMVNDAVAAMPQLSDDAKYDLAIRVYDLLQYENADYAKRFLTVVRAVYRRDSADQKFAATNQTIWAAAKVMLIKDEPYVAYLLTRYEKKVRDMAKYDIDEANGDKIVYRHHTSPEFNLGKKRIRFQITTTDWMLNIVRRMKWWRKLPGWHSREQGFRDWFLDLPQQFDLSTEAGYAQALRVLHAVEPVEGYREVRYPKMEAARAEIEADLSSRPERTIHRDALQQYQSAVRA